MSCKYCSHSGRYLVLLNKFTTLHFGSLSSSGTNKVNTMCVPIVRLHCQTQTVERLLYVEMEYYALLKSFEDYSSAKQFYMALSLVALVCYLL